MKPRSFYEVNYLIRFSELLNNEMEQVLVFLKYLSKFPRGYIKSELRDVAQFDMNCCDTL